MIVNAIRIPAPTAAEVICSYLTDDVQRSSGLQSKGLVVNHIVALLNIEKKDQDLCTLEPGKMYNNSYNITRYLLWSP